MSIAIVGAGLSGLICARILQQRHVSVTVYEADSAPDARRQGGLLDIHSDTGQVALKEAGLYEQFLARVHVGGEAIRILDKNARILLDRGEPEGGNGRPEIGRTDLREMLIDSLAPGTIAWGRKVVAAWSGSAGNVLEFADGATVTADLVIGADGAWSKVRRLLTSVKPEYTGITVVELRLSDAAARHRDAVDLVGPGNFFALSDNKYIGGHGGEQISFGCGLRVPEDWTTTAGIDGDDPVSTRDRLVAEFPDWDRSLTDLIRNGDDAIWPRPIYALPTGHTWTRTPGVTLVGDAAHLMSPFAGEGANIALIDGADLARAIIDNAAVDDAVAAYEQKMFPRAAKAAKASANGLDLMFRDGPPRKMVGLFRWMIRLSRVTRPFTRLRTTEALAQAAHSREN